MEHYCCYLTLSISTLMIILPNNCMKPKKGKKLTTENISPSVIPLPAELSNLGLEDNRFEEKGNERNYAGWNYSSVLE